MSRRLIVAACLLGSGTLGLVAWGGQRLATPVTSVVAVADTAAATAVAAPPAPSPTGSAPVVPVETGSTNSATPTTVTPPAASAAPTGLPTPAPLPAPAPVVAPAPGVAPAPVVAPAVPGPALPIGPRYSALPEPAVAPIAPRSLRVDSAGVRDRPIRPVGIEPSGELEIPDETEIGWYRLGSSPGRPGATVLAAHVSWNRSLGPFARLAAAKPGDPVELTLADGSLRRYRIVELAQYPKGALPADRIFSAGGDERLVLITCGGSFNPSIRRYLDNIVAYAVPEPG